MNVSLSHLKISKRRSRQTIHFSAKICVDGVVIGEASNTGWGGSNDYHWIDRVKYHDLNDFAKKQFPKFDNENIDALIDDLIQNHEHNESLRRYCKKKLLFRVRGDRKGIYRTLTHPYSKESKNFVMLKYPTLLEEIINERFLTPA